MTKDQFKESIGGIGGEFNFYTADYEGLIFATPTRAFIWVDFNGYRTADVVDEPKNIGDYNSVDELLDAFEVDGVLFSESVLPKITTLSQVYT